LILQFLSIILFELVLMHMFQRDHNVKNASNMERCR